MGLFSSLINMGAPLNNNNITGLMNQDPTQGLNQMVQQEMLQGEGNYSKLPIMKQVNSLATGTLSQLGLK